MDFKLAIIEQSLAGGKGTILRWEAFDVVLRLDFLRLRAYLVSLLKPTHRSNS